MESFSGQSNEKFRSCTHEDEQNVILLEVLWLSDANCILWWGEFRAIIRIVLEFSREKMPWHDKCDSMSFYGKVFIQQRLIASGVCLIFQEIKSKILLFASFDRYLLCKRSNWWNQRLSLDDYIQCTYRTKTTLAVSTLFEIYADIKFLYGHIMFTPRNYFYVQFGFSSILRRYEER